MVARTPGVSAPPAPPAPDRGIPMKPSFTPPCPPAFKVDAGLGFKPPAERDPNYKGPVVAEPPKASATIVIEALCLGLNLANSVGDANKAELFNEALSSFTSLSYERGKFTRENELLRADVEWLRNEVHLMMKDRLAK